MEKSDYKDIEQGGLVQIRAAEADAERIKEEYGENSMEYADAQKHISDVRQQYFTNNN